MQDKKLPWHSVVWAIVRKDALCELRSKYAFSALTMFALITLASISMSLAGAAVSSALAAALLWIILFFCAMAGLSRIFVQEQEAGTLLTLRLYANAQAVYWGKTCFNSLLLLVLTVLILPLFILLLDVSVPLCSELGVVLVLGDIGIATVSTLTALMICRAGGKGSLYTVITFPLLLPQFLMVIAATTRIFYGTLPGIQDFVFMAGYDITVLCATSILFDYLWYD